MKTNTLFTLTFVVGLLVSSSIAAPISNKRRVSKRDEAPAACPGTLRGPSGNAYYAFSSALNNKVAQQACASCYDGVLADVGVTDMQFLTENLEQTSWIKSWNGDDYSGSCLTIQPNGGGAPSVGVDSTCAVETWPLCQAASTQADGAVRVQGPAGATLTSLAVPFAPSEADDAPPATPETTTTSDEEVAAVELEVAKTEENAPADPATTSTDDADNAAVEVVLPNSDEAATKTSEDWGFDPEATYNTPGGNIVAEAEVVELVPTETEPEAAADPSATYHKPGHVDDIAEVEEIAPTKTDPETACNPKATYSQPDDAAAEVVVEEAPTKTEPEAAADPEATCDKPGNIVVAEAEVEEVALTKTELETAADPEVAYNNPEHSVAEAEVEETVATKTEAETPANPKATTTADAEVAEVVEVGMTPAQGTSPAPAATEEDPLLVTKEKVRAAFEEDKEACSAELAMGEQDPITNEYEIEHMSTHGSCSASKMIVS
ncbi:hypothetical protein EMPS_11224 [Entomortierella parvispora]|uniref:Uncharacterized protein n=1 Tax=Entomortierella parvispora TaxID=205924 RepID=A0A9P3M2B5_9FUNG|nr:hypothetical protein EMPS_11224 [Entomortierella parvispora]